MVRSSCLRTVDLENVALVSLARIQVCLYNTPVRDKNGTRHTQPAPSPGLDKAERDPRGFSPVLPPLPYPLAPRVDTTWYSRIGENDWPGG